jgi:small subunit ribosomal protein S2
MLSGILDMGRLPAALFVIDVKREKNCIREAKKLGIPIVAVVDTNCDPDDADFPIPGNDDAVRAIQLFSGRIAEAVQEGRDLQQAHEEERAEEEAMAKKIKQDTTGEAVDEEELPEAKKTKAAEKKDAGAKKAPRRAPARKTARKSTGSKSEE